MEGYVLQDSSCLREAGVPVVPAPLSFPWRGYFSLWYLVLSCLLRGGAFVP